MRIEVEKKEFMTKPLGLIFETTSPAFEVVFKIIEVGTKNRVQFKGQRAEVGGQRAEVRDQGSEVRGRRSGMGEIIFHFSFLIFHFLGFDFFSDL